MWLSMPYNTAKCIFAPGNAECISDLVTEKSIAKGVRSDKWTEKFCRKFIDNLNMRSLIASLVLSILLLNFDAICNLNDQLGQRESNAPRPFFPLSSKKYLVDYYTGNDAKPENLLHNSEIVIVMYYAPWSRRCIRTRVIFEKVAKSLSEASDMAFAVSYEFQQYIKAALIAFQHQNLLDKVGFAIVTNSSLVMSVNSSPKAWIQLRSWNGTFNYNESNMTAYKIFEWVKNRARKSNGFQWINPEMNGVAKSEELLSILQHSATVVVFVDRQVLYPHNWAVSLVEQTIMEYYTCDADLVSQMKSRSNRLDALVNERSRIIAMNSHKCQKISAHTLEVSCLHCQLPLFFYNTYSSLFHNVPCLSVLSTLSEEQLISHCCAFLISKNQHLDTSQETFEHCAKYRLARDLYRHISDSSPSICCPPNAKSITGLSCDKNNSLRFIGIDSRYGDYVLKRLKGSYSGRTVALIVDPNTERTFFMQDEFSRHTFREFLRSFHSGSLTPHIISQASREEPKILDDNLSVLSSTNAKTFRTDVNSTEDTVMFFSGGNWHGPSASVIHIYHSVAHYFRPFLKLIKFHVIDVSLNDLPWQFQMDTLPAVLFFPAGRELSSSRFPTLVPFTMPNLIAFIVTRCQRELRWQLALSSCSLLCVKKNTLRLQKIAIMIKNDITLLRLLAFSSYQYSYLFRNLIRRRSEQLHSTRRLLKVLSMSKFS
ncbi:unnamed protein product [Onchocerca ochengi]|uniref:Thioredoxin domain-containing protein n=1 Tax=Onchocerca ochengi TaxID=42157 RepID=A0A182DXX0_ONCOC|nr:unnamed protein product [Onchocerca ochengi]